jgi:hypothetical protein
MHEELQGRSRDRSAQGGQKRLLHSPRVRLGAVIALAVAAGLIAWLVIDSGGSSSKPKPAASKPTTKAKPSATFTHIGPVNLSADGLKTLSGNFDETVYWAGPKPGYQYELTRTTDGKVYVRYLPRGVKAGDKRSNFLIVATYPFANALGALKGVAKGKGTTLPGGGYALPDASYAKSVHLAFPGAAYQIEVYDPSPRRALQVAMSGNVEPVR